MHPPKCLLSNIIHFFLRKVNKKNENMSEKNVEFSKVKVLQSEEKLCIISN